MKFRKPGALVALLFAGCLHALAQDNPLPVNQPDYNKPKIFADLPDRLELRLADAESLLALPVGAAVNANIATGFQLTGTVVSKSGPADPKSQSVVVKSTNRSRAIFSFSRVKKEDGTTLYRGRMMSREAGDVLEIVKENNAYVIRKKAYYDVVNE